MNIKEVIDVLNSPSIIGTDMPINKERDAVYYSEVGEVIIFITQLNDPITVSVYKKVNSNDKAYLDYLVYDEECYKCEHYKSNEARVSVSISRLMHYFRGLKEIEHKII